MKSTIRLISKAVTWQVAGLIVMTTVGFVFTGSIAAGGGIAVVGSCVGFVSCFLHEMAWSRVFWGKGLKRTT